MRRVPIMIGTSQLPSGPITPADIIVSIIVPWRPTSDR